MKKFSLLLAVLMATMVAGCNKPDPEEEETFALSLEVTGIENNQATVKASLTEGTFYGAKIVEMYNSEDLTIDPSKDIQLVNFVESNGTDITLPYENTLTGIRIGKTKITAVIAYDETGRAAVTAYKEWDPQGDPAGWSTENNPGNLEEIVW